MIGLYAIKKKNGVNIISLIFETSVCNRFLFELFCNCSKHTKILKIKF